MPAQLAVPPLDGSTTVLPGFVDFQAKYNSSRPWALFPPTSASKRTFFTYGELADATHRIAHTYCPDGVRANGEIMAVIAHPDSILYLALVAGLARAGFVVSTSFEVDFETPCSRGLLALSDVPEELAPSTGQFVGQDGVPPHHHAAALLLAGGLSQGGARAETTQFADIRPPRLSQNIPELY